MVVVLNVKRVRPKRIICARLARTEDTHVSIGRPGWTGRFSGSPPGPAGLLSALKWVSYAGWLSSAQLVWVQEWVSEQ